MTHPTAAEVLALIRDVREIAAWLADACYWTRADKLREAAALLEQRQSARDAALEEAEEVAEYRYQTGPYENTREEARIIRDRIRAKRSSPPALDKQQKEFDP